LASKTLPCEAVLSASNITVLKSKTGCPGQCLKPCAWVFGDYTESVAIMRIITRSELENPPLCLSPKGDSKTIPPAGKSAAPEP
jgi:hypothetical protein